MKQNHVAHFEIYANQPDKLSDFYSQLFDWTIETVPGMDYRLVKTTETNERGMPTSPGGINGGIAKRPDGYNDRAWVNYVNVDSIEASVERAQKLGATLMKEKLPVPGMGWFAMLTDPEGNIFSLWQTDPNAK